MALANGHATVRALGFVRLVFITKFSRIGPDWCFSYVFFWQGQFIWVCVMRGNRIYVVTCLMATCLLEACLLSRIDLLDTCLVRRCRDSDRNIIPYDSHQA